MIHWLTPIPQLLQADSPFVIATVWAIDGSSPDSVGARLVITRESCFGQLQSTHRQQTLIAQSREILAESHCNFLKKEYPLGHIAGTTNGFSTVVYEKFSAPYPDWLLSLENTIQKKTRVELSNTITDRSSDISSVWEILIPGSSRQTKSVKNPGKVSQSGQSQTLSDVVKLSEFSVAVIGDSAVAIALIKQLALLPINTLWLSEQEHPNHASALHRQKISDQAIDALPENAQIAIATKTHELDISCCYRALLNKKPGYIGCLGSIKKSAVVKNRLKEMGIRDERLEQLIMPIGLPTITGKHPAIIAASIVAQLLSIDNDYFSA